MRKKAILLLLTLTVALNVSACGNKEKKNVLSEDVKQEVAMQENETKKFIDDGIDFLNKGEYDDAKSSFEKAISMDKSNKGAYIEIKNRYMEKQRMDDAYYIIKLAISNGVDTENMQKILNDIKSKFEVTKLSESAYQNGEYKLPTKIKAKINNEDKEVNVVWNDNKVDTSKLGSIKYEGKIEQYDRSAELDLEIIKVEKAKKIGGISKVYEENGKRYLKFDEVEFYKNKDGNDSTAENEARKDGADAALFDEGNVEGRLNNGYYIRNKDKSLKTYEISPNVDISVCGYSVNLNTIDQQNISYEKFKTLDMGDRIRFKGVLCYIHLENNVVVKIEEQYIP
ncbi:Ig-like domain-containing protein [Clostridium sp. MSJ-11]|uniref:Ig-like domain-containing protein n=1 Tax=Clostridium mobile TaxID=2841512 RepID=A0ABS6EFX9_9CLOT|nr:Ig-like domain-containing protein [Clostridium mobile]MBU5484131.1 Ig-like domain-containing protein [Clostridium mobile]